jgi:ferritin
MSEEESRAGRRKMMIDTSIGEQLVDQFTMFLYSSNFYRTAALWAKNRGLPGVAYYLNAQRKERRHSATHIHRFLDSAGMLFSIPEIDVAEAPLEANTLEDLFTACLDNEIKITESLNIIALNALEAKCLLAHYFVSKELYFQLGEEDEARDRIQFTKVSDNELVIDARVDQLMKGKKKKEKSKK